MAELPPVAAGFVRIAVLIAEGMTLTPGQAAKEVGIPLDDIGHVAVVGREALVDVKRHQAETARAALGRLGPTQFAGAPPAPPTWTWVKLHLGRNHGLTIGQLKKVLARVGATHPGRIQINNTHTMVGLREDELDPAVNALKELKINGMAARPGPPLPGEVRGTPQFTPTFDDDAPPPRRF